jgi:hypothetical protein
VATVANPFIIHRTSKANQELTSFEPVCPFANSPGDRGQQHIALQDTRVADAAVLPGEPHASVGPVSAQHAMEQLASQGEHGVRAVQRNRWR